MTNLIVALSLVTVLTSACAPLVILGGTASAGATLSKNKTVGSSLDDTNIWTKIKASFLSHNKEIPGIMTDVSVEVSEGRVLLTGFVSSAEDKLKILQIVWEQRGVREVINELKVKGVDEDNGSYITDTLITTKVKSKFLMNKEIRSVNYNVETINSVVYILGIAGSEQELYQVIHEAESVPNIQKVITYIKINKPNEVKENGEAYEATSDKEVEKKTDIDESKIQHEEKKVDEETSVENTNSKVSPKNKKNKIEYMEMTSDEETEIEIGQESD